MGRRRRTQRDDRHPTNESGSGTVVRDTKTGEHRVHRYGRYRQPHVCCPGSDARWRMGVPLPSSLDDVQRGCVASGSCTVYEAMSYVCLCGSVTLSLARVRCRWYAMICVGVGARCPIDRTATRTDSIVETSTHVTHIASSYIDVIATSFILEAQPHPSSYHLESSLTLYCSVFAVYLCAARVATLCSLRRVSHASKPRQAPGLARPQKTNPPGAPLRPLHRRRWLPSPWIVSNNRPHISHGYCPNSFIIAGPAAPER